MLYIRGMAFPLDLSQPLELAGDLIRLRTFPQPGTDARQIEILSDPTTMYALGYMSQWTSESLAKRDETFLNEMRRNQAILFLIYDAASNDIIGMGGIRKIDSINHHAEVGHIIHHTHWGTGAAIEFGLLVYEYAFTILKLHRLYFHTTAKNVRVLSLAEKMGVAQESIVRDYFHDNGTYKDSCLYAFFDHDWPAIKKKLQDRLRQQKKTS